MKASDSCLMTSRNYPIFIQIACTRIHSQRVKMNLEQLFWNRNTRSFSLNTMVLTTHLCRHCSRSLNQKCIFTTLLFSGHKSSNLEWCTPLKYRWGMGSFNVCYICLRAGTWSLKSRFYRRWQYWRSTKAAGLQQSLQFLEAPTRHSVHFFWSNLDEYGYSLYELLWQASGRKDKFAVAQIRLGKWGFVKTKDCRMCS